MKYVVLNKEIGKTPLQTINEWKTSHHDYAHVAASYAGRLDPMASGKLLILLGDECKKQKDYTALDKEYEIEILLDAKSDTGDVLGIPEIQTRETRISSVALAPFLKKEVGTHTHPYPVFSSKTVEGKPLFLHTLEGNLKNIAIPEHEETIYSIQVINSSRIEHITLSTRIQNLLTYVPTTTEPSKRLGRNFRKEEISKRWEELFSNLSPRSFQIIRLRVICGSGTYMRTLAERIGTSLNTSALALSIHRTKIGRYRTIGPFSFWTKQF